MKPRISRETIVSTTIDLITRYGIRAVRVDEIAAALGISKRTLYEIFSDKTELIVTCIDEISSRQQDTYLKYLEQHETDGEALENLLWLMNQLIDSLYKVDRAYLVELEKKIDFQPVFLAGRKFWEETIDRLLQRCVATGFLNPIPTDFPVALRMLSTSLAYRFGDVSREEQRIICRIFIRGVATEKGIEWLDNNPNRPE